MLNPKRVFLVNAPIKIGLMETGYIYIIIWCLVKENICRVVMPTSQEYPSVVAV